MTVNFAGAGCNWVVLRSCCRNLKHKGKIPGRQKENQASEYPSVSHAKMRLRFIVTSDHEVCIQKHPLSEIACGSPSSLTPMVTNFSLKVPRPNLKKQFS